MNKMESNNILNNTAESTNAMRSRVFHRKKKSMNNYDEYKNLNAPIDTDSFIESAFVKWEKVLGKLPHRNYYLPSGYHRRLSGGADRNINNANKNLPSTTADESLMNNSTVMPQQNDTQVSFHRHSIAVSENKIDEIIDCAIQNLQEAGKALVTLGENHEHEIKLLVTDLLPKFQKLIDMVRKKLDGARNDVDSIRQVLMAQTIMLAEKNRELTDLQVKLTKCEADKAAYEKELNVNRLKTIDQSTSYTSAISNPAASLSAEHSSTAGVTPSHLQSATTIQSSVTPTNQIIINSSSQPSTSSKHKIPITPAASQNLLLSSNERDTLHPTISTSIVPAVNSSGPSTQNVAINNVTPGIISIPSMTVTRKTSSNQIRIANNVMAKSSIEHRDKQTPVTVSVSEQTNLPQSTLESAINSGTMTNDITSRTVPTSNKNDDNEQNKHVDDLKVELAQLRDENDRMKRDHAEYEESIQRALLQGVSSLNAEALKVLRNPPFICYKPCEPCNTLQSSSPSNNSGNVPCILQDSENYSAQRNKKNLSKAGVITKSHDNDAGHSSSRRQATGVCYAPANRSSPNGMLLLLPQHHVDCACTTTVQQYCINTNYNKTIRGLPREKIYCTSHVTTGRDGFRGGLMRSYTRALEPCEPPCHRNRRFIPD